MSTKTNLLPRLKVEILRTLTLGRAHEHIAAGSGVTKVGKWLYVVADDELFLAGFRLDRRQSALKVPLFDGELPEDHAARKKAKPDLEALLHFPGANNLPGHLLAVPSGSKPNRVRGGLVPLARSGRAKQPPLTIDFTALYARLGGLISDLNIEGASFDAHTFSLYQRGNAKNAQSAIVELHGEGLIEELLRAQAVNPERLRSVTPYQLGKLENVRLSFTDATFFGGVRWLVAAAEDTEDAYNDGQCKGSVLGTIEADGEVRYLGIIDFPQKVEGIHAEAENNRTRLYFVTDADERKIPSSLLTLLV